jgi:hypothetical protein
LNLENILRMAFGILIGKRDGLSMVKEDQPRVEFDW